MQHKEVIQDSQDGFLKGKMPLKNLKVYIECDEKIHWKSDQALE